MEKDTHTHIKVADRYVCKIIYGYLHTFPNTQGTKAAAKRQTRIVKMIHKANRTLTILMPNNALTILTMLPLHVASKTLNTITPPTTLLRHNNPAITISMRLHYVLNFRDHSNPSHQDPAFNPLGYGCCSGNFFLSPMHNRKTHFNLFFNQLRPTQT
jgi:hypothetical protein